MQPTQYKILTGDYSHKLSEEVNAYLAQGWKLSGGVSISYYRTSTMYAQAQYAQALYK